MYTYTLAFIKNQDEILMVNRQKKPWLGCWNGLGGKLSTGESPLQGILRELFEETGQKFQPEDVKDCGVMTWNTFDAHGQGLHLFLIYGDKYPKIKTPLATDEGILDWKSLDWIIDPKNYGVAHNIRYFLPIMMTDQTRHHFHCTFENERLMSVTKEVIDHVS